MFRKHETLDFQSSCARAWLKETCSLLHAGEESKVVLHQRRYEKAILTILLLRRKHWEKGGGGRE